MPTEGEDFLARGRFPQPSDIVVSSRDQPFAVAGEEYGIDAIVMPAKGADLFARRCLLTAVGFFVSPYSPSDNLLWNKDLWRIFSKTYTYKVAASHKRALLS